MKIVPFALLILIACGGSEVEDKEGYHCYLYSAFYLIEGDAEVACTRTEEVKHLWEGWGQIEDAF